MGSASKSGQGTGRRFDVMIGTGGIGWGRFFAISGNETLGREESRLGRFLDRRDYCKLHIISHYVKALGGDDFRVLPVGKVGDDEPGGRLVDEMRKAGLDTRFVGVQAGKPTLNCICLLYPDGSGGNLTVEDSACSTVDGSTIRKAEGDFAAAAGKGIALAVPEVPIEARRELLEMATQYRFFRAASFVSGEIRAALESGLLAHVDLLAINSAEAAALCGKGDQSGPSELAAAAYRELHGCNAKAILAMTAGSGGSWVVDAQGAHHLGALKVTVASAAGAGDAFLAGMLAGLAEGLPVPEAQQLATLTAAASVTSPHTIHDGICRSMLAGLARDIGAVLEPAVKQFIEERP
jgi:sugar/nucleoside kinase (ribokinase family)